MPVDSDRNLTISNFLDKHQWGVARRIKIAGDASNRRYDRLSNSETGETRILMDAPPDGGPSIVSFISIARFLSLVGLSAPEILAIDETNGLLLLEDFGDAVFARLIDDDPSQEFATYLEAVNVLAHLHDQSPPEGIVPYSCDLMTELAALSYDWYLFGATGDRNEPAKTQFKSAMNAALKSSAASNPVLILRDYHCENLIWLPERDGAKRVGLLDFQDAMLGHPAYDLASLLNDARRDVSPNVKQAMIDHYIASTNSNADVFNAAFSAVSAQRNLRIIGGFSRLSLHFGKSGYCDLLPRVWRNLLIDLEHPTLAGLRETVLRDLPEPTASVIQVLKKKCATVPNL